jgi:hypothetical protein
VRFPEHHDMVEAFASDRSNQPFNMTVLPRRAGHDWSVSDAHGSQSACDRDTIRSVAVTDQVTQCRVRREWVICRAIHSAVGVAVTLVQTRRRRSKRRMTSP